MNTIIDRIKKLLALSNSTNEHEAANAAALAAELMLQHKIDQADLAVEDEAQEEVAAWRVGSDKTNVGWKGVMLVGLFYAFGCWGSKSAQRGWRVIGRKSDVDTVRYLFDYLVNEVNRLADEGWERHQYETYDSIRRWKNAFRVGAAGVIQRRLKEQHQQTMKAAEEAGKTSALVYIGKQEEQVALACRQRGIKFQKTGRDVSGSSHDGYARGREAGKDVVLGGGRGQLAAGRKQLA